MMLDTLRQDWLRNRISLKSILIVIFFRISGWFANHSFLLIRIVGFPVRALYKLLVEFVLGVELPDRVRAGPGLAVFHGVGLVVNASAVLGANVTLRQNTTIGAKAKGEPAPIIGDNVNIGANVVLIGGITIGTGSSIGAGAIVVETCPPGSVIYSQKAIVQVPVKYKVNVYD